MQTSKLDGLIGLGGWVGGGAAIAAPPPTGPPGFKPDERQIFPATHGQNTLKLARQDGRRSPGLYLGYTKNELSHADCHARLTTFQNLKPNGQPVSKI